MENLGRRRKVSVRSTHATRNKSDYLVFPLPKASEPPLKELDISEYCDGIRDGEYIHVRISKQFYHGKAADGSYVRTTGFAKHPKGTSTCQDKARFRFSRTVRLVCFGRLHKARACHNLEHG